MSRWDVVYMPEAERDFAALDGSQRILVRKMIERVRENPLPDCQLLRPTADALEVGACNCPVV